MKQKLLLITAIIFSFAFKAGAQNLFKINGQIKDAAGNGAAGATVTLHQAKDSALVK